MPKLNETQLKNVLRREEERQKALKKKQEAQKNKELYGENWKQVLHQKIQKEMELEIGSEKTPKVYDFQDMYSFFDPISYYRDNEGKELQMDYKKFEESEQKYERAIVAADEELKKLEEESGVKNDTQSVLEDDGTSTADDILPVINSDDDSKSKDSASKKVKQLKKNSNIAQGKKDNLMKVATYLNRYTPLYNVHVCTCCGTPKKVNDFYITSDITCNNRVDVKGNFHMHLCKDCCQKMLMYVYSTVASKNIELAMQMTCAYLNLYWDVDSFYKAKDDFEAKDRKGTLIGSYIAIINSEQIGKTFMDSPFLTDEQYNSKNRVVTEKAEDSPFDWSKEDARNKKTVIRMVGYDPFIYYENEEDKKILYRDLLNILDEGMQNDFVKFQAGIEIVKSFFKLRQLDKREHDMVSTNATVSEMKGLAELKAKELKAISDFSKDNGFSERYATAKAKGENSLTGIMNKMNEMKYEKAIINKYDIQTSATIQQAADASFKAIFDQLGLGEAEVWKTTQDQFVELTKLRKENDRLTEELRLARVELAKIRLEGQAKQMRAERGEEDEDDE